MTSIGRLWLLGKWCVCVCTTPASRFSIDELCWWHTLYTIVTHLLEQENLCFKTLLKTLLSLACGQTSVVFSNRPLVKLDLWVENGTNEISEKWNKHFEVACISFREVYLVSYGRSLDVLSGQYRTQNYLEGMLKKTPIYLLTNRFFLFSGCNSRKRRCGKIKHDPAVL